MVASHTVCLLAGAASALVLAWAAPPSATESPRIEWDSRTLLLVGEGGCYGRMARLADGRILCAFERAGKSWVRRSSDEGATWGPPVLAAHFPFGTAANPELLALRDGRVLLFTNERPTDGKHPFTIRAAASTDGGDTWMPLPPLYVAGTEARRGCWEPAALQLPTGEIRLFFANEHTLGDGQQEITGMRSHDGGKTWSAPERVSFRAGGRDGMPVPLLLSDGGVIVAIEDNGTPTHKLQPAILGLPGGADGSGPWIDGGSARRWWAIEPALPRTAYAGAPYLCRLSTGEVLLSCQSDEGQKHSRMVVYVGDRAGRRFTGKSVPFAAAGESAGLWNSLFAKGPETVTALSSTTIGGRAGVWAIDGRVVRPTSR